MTSGIAVAIPALNEQFAIGNLLDDLKRLPDGLVDSVTVIDGRSDDETRSVVQSRGAALLDNPLRHAASARQIALDTLDGEYICFLDADCRLLAGWPEAVMRGLAAGYDAFGGPFALANPESRVAVFSAELFDRVMDFGDEERVLESASVGGSIAGGNLVVRREAAQSIGGFDLRIGNFGEDLDLVWRLLASDARVGYLPQMRVAHHFPSTKIELVKTWYKYGRASSALAARHLSTPAIDSRLWAAAVRSGVRSLRSGSQDDRLSFLQLTAHLAGKLRGSMAERIVNL